MDRYITNSSKAWDYTEQVPTRWSIDLIEGYRHIEFYCGGRWHKGYPRCRKPRLLTRAECLDMYCTITNRTNGRVRAEVLQPEING